MTPPNDKPEPTDEEVESAMQDFIDAFKGLSSLLSINKRMKDKHLNPDEDMTIDEAKQLQDAVLDEMDYKRRQFHDKATKFVDLDWSPDDDDQQLK